VHLYTVHAHSQTWEMQYPQHGGQAQCERGELNRICSMLDLKCFQHFHPIHPQKIFWHFQVEVVDKSLQGNVPGFYVKSKVGASKCLQCFWPDDNFPDQILNFAGHAETVFKIYCKLLSALDCPRMCAQIFAHIIYRDKAHNKTMDYSILYCIMRAIVMYCPSTTISIELLSSVWFSFFPDQYLVDYPVSGRLSSIRHIPNQATMLWNRFYHKIINAICRMNILHFTLPPVCLN
jgi:hypothetical protein